jgi:YVTN family beta-propeller protein
MTVRRTAVVVTTLCALLSSCFFSHREIIAPSKSSAPGAVTADDQHGNATSPSRRILALIPVDNLPEGIAVGHGSVWVANHGSGSVSRVDPGTDRVIATIALGRGPARIVIASGSVWVTDDREPRLWRIDPRTNRATPLSLRGRVSGIPSIAMGALWVTIWDDATLVRIDPATNRSSVVAHLAGQPIGVQFANGSFWVAGTAANHGVVSRIDAVTFRTSATIPAGGLPWFQDESVGDGSLWVADALFRLVIRIDTTTNRVRGIWQVNQVPVVAVADGLVWVNQADRTISRIDPLTNRIVERLKLGGSLGGVASGFGAVWLVGSRDGMLWRLAGTL